MGGREGQSLRNILIKLEGEDPRQKGFHFIYFLNGRSGEESKTIKIKKVLQKIIIMGAKEKERDNYK